MAQENVVESPASSKSISEETLSQLCGLESCKASCLASALKALIEPLEIEELWGLAHILELLVKEAHSLCDDIADIPTNVLVVNHD